MKLIMGLFLLVSFFPLNAHSQLFEWTDDRGVVNFTDNPDRVPPKYRGKVRVLEDAKQEPAAREEQQPVVAPAAAAPAVKLYDGKPAQWWKSQYATNKARVEQLRAKLPGLKEELAIARRKKVTFTRLQDRKAYEAKMNEVAVAEAEIKAAEDDLAAFLVQADQAGLPADWRE